MIGTTMPTPLYPIYREAFGFSQLMITIIFAAYAFGVIAALVITGRWSDQLGRRPLLFAAIAGFAGFAVCGFFTSIAPVMMGNVLGYDNRLLVGVVAGSIHFQSLTLFMAGAVIAGTGQGIAFRAGLGAINAACPPAERAAVTSTFFIVAYIAISVPVIGIGLMASLLSLKATGIIFSVFVGSLAAVALLILLWRDHRTN